MISQKKSVEWLFSELQPSVSTLRKKKKEENFFQIKAKLFNWFGVQT
jgi:hypothetical protein